MLKFLLVSCCFLILFLTAPPMVCYLQYCYVELPPAKAKQHLSATPKKTFGKKRKLVTRSSKISHISKVISHKTTHKSSHPLKPNNYKSKKRLGSFKSRSQQSMQEELYALTINKVATHRIAFVLRKPNGELLLDAASYKRINMRHYQQYPYRYNQQLFYPLSSLPGVQYRVNAQQARLYATIPARYFQGSDFSLSHNRELVAPQPSPLGGFLNYDLFSQQNPGADNITNGTLEVGAFNHFGVVTSSFLGSHLTDKHTKFTRLATTWTIDQPMTMHSWHIGDTISVPGLWGSAVSFGGVQWGTNYGTQQDFITSPLPTAVGTAVMPSTVDLYVNNILQRRTNVTSGPFDISNIPVTSGPGTVRVVVTDVLGRQQVINVPYFASGSLLKKGLHDYSFAAGFVRKNYGIDSFNYGRYLLSANDAYGITDYLTSEVHAEISGSTMAAGIGANFALAKQWLVSTAVAGSRSNGVLGGLVLARLSGQNGIFSYGVGTKLTTKSFRLAQSDNNEPFPLAENSVYGGLFLGKVGSLGMSFIDREYHHQSGQRFLTGSYSVNIGKHLFVSLSASTNIGGQRNRSVLLDLVVPLDDRTSASASADFTRNNDKDQGQYGLQIQRTLPVGSGFGYDVEAATGENRYFRGGVSARSSYGTYQAKVATDANGKIGYQAEISGGIAALDKKLYLTRRLYQSFALVRVPNIGGVPVYWENHHVATTDKKGNAFVPYLMPYVRNHISIHPAQLPLNTTINATKLEVIPYFRSGVIVHFPIKVSRAAIVHIKLLNGKPLPIGTQLAVNSHNTTTYVAEDGLAYFTDLGVVNHVMASWNGQRCSFRLRYPHHRKRLIPDLGVAICRKQEM